MVSVVLFVLLIILVVAFVKVFRKGKPQQGGAAKVSQD